MTTFGDKLRQLRVERGLDLAAAARLSGLQERRLASLEEDPTGAFYDEAAGLAQAYGLTLTGFGDAVEAARWPRPGRRRRKS